MNEPDVDAGASADNDLRPSGLWHSESGQISLIRLLVVLAILGFGTYEAGAVIITRVQVSDIARHAGSSASLTYFNQRGDAAAARRQAQEFVENRDAEFIEATIDPRAEEVRVTAARDAPTLLVHRVERFEHLARVRVTETVPLRR